MLIIEFRFPAGRYHATPWGRNVNEGEVEWPPSPYRLARAIIDIWKRRRPEWSETRVRPLLEAFSGTPRFCLPLATTAHTRSYLSTNGLNNPLNKQLIFDAFVIVGRDEKLLVGLETALDASALGDLNELLSEMNYLGRSESWVEARAYEGDTDIKWNCTPSTVDFDPGGSTVGLACLRGPTDYAELSHRPEKIEWNGKKLKKTGKACSWVEAVCMDTKRLLDEGWSAPPALLWSQYLRAKNVTTASIPSFNQEARVIRCARYALTSKVLPRIAETASVAEKIRHKLMGIHKHIQSDNPLLVSPKFSGKDAGGNPLQGHRHAFFIPTDEDDDGRLDHLMIHAADPYEPSELLALDKLRSVWQSNGRPDVNIVLVSLTENPPGQQARKWVSVTPFVTARHYRRGRGSYLEWLSDEIRRECRFHGHPDPITIEWISATIHSGHPLRWFEFIRGKKEETPLRGHGCIISFDEPVMGPIALGAACHYGLGQFVPHEG
ncbi:MAG: type I-U CRISPR-associated protein Csb2 [Syntrophobacteraceae bacterium]